MAVLKASKVVKEFPPPTKNQPTVRALDGLDFEIRGKTFVTMVGPSGCGKTTLLNLCSGFDKPTSGTVTLSGRLRMVYQQDGLFPWQTVRENIELGFRHLDNDDERKLQLREMINLIGLEGFDEAWAPAYRFAFVAQD